MLASLSASSDSTDDTAGITLVPGYPAALTIAGRSSATRSGRHNNKPACLVSTRSGHVLEVDHAGPRQLLASGRAAQHLRAAPQPLESFLGDHLRDPGAIQRHSLPREHERDLVDRVTRRAQFNDPVVRAVLARVRAWVPGVRRGRTRGGLSGSRARSSSASRSCTRTPRRPPRPSGPPAGRRAAPRSAAGSGRRARRRTHRPDEVGVISLTGRS